ncbi:unnamed protein product, partial [Gongylonema pulchrum]|uniref:Ovule protein n=1 Tax=Gongylonema pulchrum TaxID=637853 RepID=A0A183D5R8_9BILA
GGARVVQTHGSGLIHGGRSAIHQRDRSLSQQRLCGDRGTEHHRTTLIDERSANLRPAVSSPMKSGTKEVGFLESVRLLLFFKLRELLAFLKMQHECYAFFSDVLASTLLI